MNAHAAVLPKRNPSFTYSAQPCTTYDTEDFCHGAGQTRHNPSKSNSHELWVLKSPVPAHGSSGNLHTRSIIPDRPSKPNSSGIARVLLHGGGEQWRISVIAAA
jgi:hypothetical protein